MPSTLPNLGPALLKRLTAAALLLAVAVSVTPWEVAAGADALAPLGCSFTVGEEGATTGSEPAADKCACLCSLCPASVLGCWEVPASLGSMKTLVAAPEPPAPGQPHATGDPAPLFRPPRHA